MAAETGTFDLYGFELVLNQQEKADRYACAQYAARREAKWERFVKSQSLPEGAMLKRYVRKVCFDVARRCKTGRLEKA